jgi:hypothetical protein
MHHIGCNRQNGADNPTGRAYVLMHFPPYSPIEALLSESTVKEDILKQMY